MAVKRSALGRGLDSLFEDNGIEEQTAASSNLKLRIMDCEPNKEQPRHSFDETALAELSKSIAEHGVLQPILVRPIPGGAYQIIAGERRWRAARAAGLSEIPAVIREMTEEEAMAAALIENLQREDLNPMEEALGYHTLMTTFRLTQEEAAERLGKSRPAVANALRLLRLPEAVREMVRDGRLNAGHARTLLGLTYSIHTEEVAEQIIEEDLSVRETERLVKSYNRTPMGEPEPDETTVRINEMFGLPRRHSFFDEVELSLAQALGRKIKVVTTGKEEKGQIVIDFFERDDLQRIAKALEAVEN